MASWYYDFEDGTTDGWGTDYGPATVANSTAEAFSGTHSLAVTLTGAGNPGIASLAAPPGVAAGTVLTYHLYEPAGATVVSANPYAVDGDWNYYFGGAVSLSPGAWTTLTLKVPALQAGLRYIGVEFENGGGVKTTLYLDAIGWPS